MASESTIALQIRTALAQYVKRDVASIRPADRLREDLGLDSLAMIELLFKIEEHFDLEIPNEDLSRIATVADVTAYVEEKLAAVAGAAPAVAVAPPPAARVAVPPVSPPGTAPAAAVRPPASPAATPAKVTSIKAAAKRKAGTGPVKPALNKKGSRRA